jgi:tRNA pseudouridine38-40 synthase
MDVAFKLSYLGLEDYSGFQKQPNVDTIEDIILRALKKAKVGFVIDSFTYAGRTDKGVHAWDQTVKIKMDSAKIPSRILYRINSFLPKWINFWSYAVVSPDFSPRYDALIRHYSYFFISNETPSLNIIEMKKGAEILTGTHNFEYFSKKDTSIIDYNRTLTKVEILPLENFSGLLIKVSGNSFLWQMVRRITSHLIQLGMEKVDINETIELLNRTSKKKPEPLSSGGLILEKIEYPETIRWIIDKSLLLKIRTDFQTEFQNYMQKIAVINHFQKIHSKLISEE